MEIRKTGKIWFSPYGVYKHLLRLSKTVGQEDIEKLGKYKRAREARIAAVTALVIGRNNPAYVQLPKSDPPDAYLMQESKEKIGQQDITTLEITTYRANGESLLEQLVRTKVGNVKKYSDEYILIVELLSRQGINYEDIRKHLNSTGVKFPVWTLLGKTVNGDTIAELTIINPKTHSLEINIGKAAHELKQSGVHDVISVERVGSVDKVRKEPAGEYEKAPWD